MFNLVRMAYYTLASSPVPWLLFFVSFVGWIFLVGYWIFMPGAVLEHHADLELFVPGIEILSKFGVPGFAFVDVLFKVTHFFLLFFVIPAPACAGVNSGGYPFFFFFLVIQPSSLIPHSDFVIRHSLFFVSFFGWIFPALICNV